MSYLQLPSVGAYLHFEPCKFKSNTWQFYFYNPKIDESFNPSPVETVSGFFIPVEYPDMTLGQFVQLLTKKEFQDGTLCILKFVKLDHERFLCSNTDEKDKVWISTEPVLIDPDFKDNLFCAQFCFVGATPTFFNASSRFVYSLEIKEPLFPKNVVRPNPYTTPMLRTMKPESIEDFYNTFYYNQILVPDFVLVRSSREAAGYDLDLGLILDNSKDFDCPGDYKEAQRDSFTVKAKYLYDIVLPNFYNSGFEMNGRSGDFMLRSSVSRKGISLTFSVIDDHVDPSIGGTVKLTIHNHNNFDVKFSVVEGNFSFRFLQFVPSMEFQYYLNQCPDFDARAKLLGVTLVQNDKCRKEKV